VADGPGGPQFGLFMPQLRMDFATIEKRARVAEGLGFHSFWLMDHMAAPAAPQWDTLEGWTTASALAARTTSIRLGHMVLCNQFRHPALLAKMAATLDVISGGRLELGLGWGSVEAELESFGFESGPAASRASRLAETLEILELMFSGEPFDYEGSHFRLSGALGRPRPIRGRVPVHIGGAGQRLTLPLAARFADWWNCPSYAVERLPELRSQVGQARISVQHPVGLAPTTQAVAQTEGQLTKRFGGWGGLVCGTPDAVASALASEVELGVELFILQFSDFGDPATLELFAAEVMPRLAGR
jgi:alkanesulfonate monooxygenase SsuD/methylene tetrahydromethanopterin reductase-like flavin-dependent oxidoreductase (luciferase family)